MIIGIVDGSPASKRIRGFRIEMSSSGPDFYMCFNVSLIKKFSLFII